MSYTTLLQTGASGNRVDIVFLGDGYTAGQLAACLAQALGQNALHKICADAAS